MAGEFRKGVSWTLLGEVVALAAVFAFSPEAREMARPYVVRGIRKALEIRDELRGMAEEARDEAARLVQEIHAETSARRVE